MPAYLTWDTIEEAVAQWKPEWPKLTLDTWDLGETMGGDERLEIYFSVGKRRFKFGKYEGHDTFDLDSREHFILWSVFEEMGFSEEDTDLACQVIEDLHAHFDIEQYKRSADAIREARNSTIVDFNTILQKERAGA